MNIQAWMIERKIKVLTDSELVDESDIKQWLGELEGDESTIVIDDELVVTRATVEFQQLPTKRAYKKTAPAKPLALPPAKTKTKMSTTDVNLPCDDCDRTFGNKLALGIHRAKAHGKAAKEDLTRIEAKTVERYKAGALTERDLKGSAREEKPFGCPHCDSRFMNKAGQVSHITLKHSGAATRVLGADAPRSMDKTCARCGKPFVTTSKSKTLCDGCLFTVPA